ncbi:MAG: nicotinamide mononucleotide transporter [Ruminococcaceae bacterium]|nr:nicotinamide mononucleotide transporter [Oscillospiraceae bacterium]
MKIKQYFSTLDIILWTLSVTAITVCFAAFLVNDIYGFVSWRRMKKRQSGKESQK